MDKEDGCHSYAVSLQKPTTVQFAVVGNFRSPSQLDLMLARVNRVDFMLVTEEGLKPHSEIPVFGRIASMSVFRLPGEELDCLLILTAKYHLAILGFDEDGSPRTRASGHVADKVGRPAETGIITTIHDSGLIALRLYEGHLKLIQWQDGKEELKNFNVRFEDYNVTEVAFLQNTGQPTVSYLYQDSNGRHLKVCEVDLEAKELRPPLWHQSNIEAEATLLIPVPAPYGGLVVVGQESISYQKNPHHFVAVAPPLIHTARINCYGRIDQTGERFLLGDMSGRLFMLLLLKEFGKDGNEEIRDLKIELLGEISIPECIVYLDNSVAFVGSRLGDSQLIRLSTEPVEPDSNSFVVVIDTFPNLGPIRDLVVMEVDGQNQIVCASGAAKEGSLRCIRSGIGIDEMATVELAGIKGIFPLRIASELDNYLVLSFTELTHLLLIDKEELEDTQIPDFELSKPTFWAGNLSPNRLLQICPDFVQLLSGDGQFHHRWNAPARISLCAVNPTSGQIVLASGAQLLYLRVQSDEILLLHQIECQNEIACLDISPLGDKQESSFFALGFWAEHSVAIYSILPGKNVQMVAEEKLGSEFLPRSLLMVSMEGIHSLFVALGDGTVMYFLMNLETGALRESKKFSLGTQPTSLHKFTTKKQFDNVFACSDRPTVFYSNNHKLTFSNVNLRSVSQMSRLNSEFYRECIALSDGANLIIGTIDDIQKLHIRTVPLNESVTRLVYQRESNMIAILTSRDEFPLFCTPTRGSRSPLHNGAGHPQFQARHFPHRPSISTMGPKHNSSNLPPSLPLHPHTQQQPIMDQQHQQQASQGGMAANQSQDNAAGYSGISAIDASSTGIAAVSVAGTSAATAGPTQMQLDGPATYSGAADAEVHSICFLDANTFDCLAVFELNKQEVGLSICSVHLGDDPHPYFAVGTSIIAPDEESKQGRVLVIQAQSGDSSSDGTGSRIRVVTEKEVKGAVYSVTSLGNKLICTVNSTVRLFEWTPERELRLECSNFNYIQALYLKTKGDLVLVGDLMRSICLLSYKPMDSSFEEIARDYSAEWTTACEIVDSETFFAAETTYNLYCCKIDVNAETEEEKMRLKQVGLYYLGEMVNVFQRGTIINSQQRDPNREILFSNSILYGTADGGLGAIVQVPPHIYIFLLQLQKAIATKTHNCTRVDHAAYRSFVSERRVEPAVGFVDGDLIETLLEMPRELLSTVIEGLRLRRVSKTDSVGGPLTTAQAQQHQMNGGMQEEQSLLTPEAVLKLVEDLTQIH